MIQVDKKRASEQSNGVPVLVVDMANWEEREGRLTVSPWLPVSPDLAGRDR